MVHGLGGVGLELPIAVGTRRLSALPGGALVVAGSLLRGARSACHGLLFGAFTRPHTALRSVSIDPGISRTSSGGRVKMLLCSSSPEKKAVLISLHTNVHLCHAL